MRSSLQSGFFFTSMNRHKSWVVVIKACSRLLQYFSICSGKLPLCAYPVALYYIHSQLKVPLLDGRAFPKTLLPTFQVVRRAFRRPFADTFDFDYNIGGAILRNDISAFFLNRAKLKAQLTKNLFDNIFKCVPVSVSNLL